MTVPAAWPAAPVPHGELARVLRPFGESCMLPARAYTDPDVLAWERRYLFAGGWPVSGGWLSCLPVV